MLRTSMNAQILTSVISAGAILTGTLIGALCTWIITKKTTYRTIEEQHKLLLDQRKYDEFSKSKQTCLDANTIRLDIYNAIFQSLRAIKYSKDDLLMIYPIAINKEYSRTIAAISETFSLRELSYIYQFYGVVERLNNQLLKYKYNESEDREWILQCSEDVLKKIYGENYKDIIEIDVENISYIDLIENDFIKSGYKNVLSKLNSMCETKCLYINN